jgi:hypothetical protein
MNLSLSLARRKSHHAPPAEGEGHRRTIEKGQYADIDLPNCHLNDPTFLAIGRPISRDLPLS